MMYNAEHGRYREPSLSQPSHHLKISGVIGMQSALGGRSGRPYSQIGYVYGKLAFRQPCKTKRRIKIQYAVVGKYINKIAFFFICIDNVVHELFGQPLLAVLWMGHHCTDLNRLVLLALSNDRHFIYRYVGYYALSVNIRVTYIVAIPAAFFIPSRKINAKNLSGQFNKALPVFSIFYFLYSR